MLFIHCVCLIVHVLFVYSAWAESDTRAHELSRYQIIEVTLKNGLRICLKKSELEPKEFEFQLFAIGGLAHLPTIDQPSAWLASGITWNSGLDQLTADELECALDDHSLEMDIKLGLFDRQIEAAGPTSELAYCLRLTKLFFTNPQFNETGLNETLTEVRQRLQNKGQASKLSDEDTALKINLRNWHIFVPFHFLDLRKVELLKAKQIFKKFFLNPAEFTLVIVGDFDPQKVIALLEESLGSLPDYPITQWNQLNPPPFPEGITKREFAGAARYRDSLTRLTFPLSRSDPVTLDLLCSILKQELTSKSTSGELERLCLNISYSFPLFPNLQPCWLVIKFSSSTADAQSICQAILTKMEKIKQKGVTEETMKLACQELASKRTQVSSNTCTLSLLADFYRAGWDIRQLYLLPNQQEKEMIKKVADCYPNLDQYSIISLHP